MNQSLIVHSAQGNATPIPHPLTVAVNNEPKKRNFFIEANTIETTLEEIRQHHVVPVFHKDNERVISQADFIQVTQEVVHDHFKGERILSPSVRVSHVVKGRHPDSIHKAASELQDWEKTIFYERMAFCIEVSSIRDEIDGEPLSLVVGGIKCHSEDNLGGKKGVDEHFKIFIAFQVRCCLNLSVFSDGLVNRIGVKSLEELRFVIQHLVQTFDAITALKVLAALPQFTLSESQFAHLLGKCRMYSYLPLAVKETLTPFLFCDTQMNAVCRDYHKDPHFAKDGKGDINLFKLHNLLTAANKSSYIDMFLQRAANATGFVGHLAYDMGHRRSNWFLE